MRTMIYSMSVTLDGYIAGRDGAIDWAAPDNDLMSFHVEQTRDLEGHLCGRALYEDMLPWEDRDDEFARLWQAVPKVVFSTTLVGNATLATGTVADEVATMKDGPGNYVSVGGARLAAALIEQDLIDEYRVFVNPLIPGGGTCSASAPQAPRRRYFNRRAGASPATGVVSRSWSSLPVWDTETVNARCRRCPYRLAGRGWGPVALYSATMSLDGYISGPDGDMSWLKDNLEPIGPDVEDLMSKIGALLVGKRTFAGDDPNRGTDEEGAFSGQWHGPSVALSHDPPPPNLPADVTFAHTLTDAVATARRAAGDKYVNVLGATVAAQCLLQGLLDEVLVLIAPVLLGDGTPLFRHPGGREVRLEALDPSRTGPTSLWFRVLRDP